jgi:anti-anti-sigma factor
VTDLASLRVRERDDLVLAEVSGEIDVSNADWLRDEITGAIANSVKSVLMDLSELDFLDSSGVHMLFELAERLERRQMGFAVVLPSTRPPRRTVELSGAQPAGWLHDDRPAALAALGAG